MWFLVLAFVVVIVGLMLLGKNDAKKRPAAGAAASAPAAPPGLLSSRLPSSAAAAIMIRMLILAVRLTKWLPADQYKTIEEVHGALGLFSLPLTLHRGASQSRAREQQPHYRHVAEFSDIAKRCIAIDYTRSNESSGLKSFGGCMHKISERTKNPVYVAIACYVMLTGSWRSISK
jgi:hypothetical protein